MRSRRSVLALALLLGVGRAQAADAETLWVELPDAAARARARAAGLAWAEGQDGDWYLLDGTPAAAEAAGLRWRADAEERTDAWAPTAAETRARLEALPSGTLVQIGESASGSPIRGVRFGDGARALRVLGGHHGDEGASVEVALRVAEALAAGAVALPDDTEVWVVPVVNPDGLDAGTRYNARGVDLNRNYAEAWSEREVASGTGPFSEPETRAVRALSRARTFDAGLSLHSGARNIGWVWNHTTALRPVEEPLLSALGSAYAAACGAPDFWTTNGADWYITYGDTTDWTYGAFGAYDFTLELTQDKSPPLEEVETYAAWHVDAILGWLSRPADLAATVVDDATGEPIPATLTGAGAAPLQTGPSGAVARWLHPEAPEEYTVAAPGYGVAPLAPETRLPPSSLGTTLPSPRLLSRGDGPTTVTLPGAPLAPLTLLQPGETTVTVAPDGPGIWTIDPSALAPGAWTLVVDGTATPRALFVGEVDDRVALAAATLDGTLLVLDGTNFAAGAEAWSIGGAARAMHPLPALSIDEERMIFLLERPDDDVLVWVNGAWLSAVDLRGRPTVDLDAPGVALAATDPTADRAAPDDRLEVSGGCATAPAAPTVALVAAFLAGRRRRGTRAAAP